MAFHYIETIPRENMGSITFTVTASDLAYIIVVDGLVINSPVVTIVDEADNRTYTYTGILPVGALFEFYYDFPLTQPDSFSRDSIDAMVSKAICRLNKVRYSRVSFSEEELNNSSRVSTFAAANVLRALGSNDGLLIEPITSPIPSTSVGILADLYNSAFSTNKPLVTLSDITEGGSYYIASFNNNNNIQLYGEAGNSFLTNGIPYTDFVIYILHQSLAGYEGHRFLGDVIEQGIPKLPALGTYSYDIVEDVVDFKYTPFQPLYRYTYLNNETQQIPVTQFPYRVRILFNPTENESDIRVVSFRDYGIERYLGVLEIVLQDALGYYYIEFESLGNTVITGNDYFPYDTSFINIGVINPEHFWIKRSIDNKIRYRTTNRVIPANVAKGITKMEVMLL